MPLCWCIIEREEGIPNPLFTISPCLSKPVHIVRLQSEERREKLPALLILIKIASVFFSTVPS